MVPHTPKMSSPPGGMVRKSSSLRPGVCTTAVVAIFVGFESVMIVFDRQRGGEAGDLPLKKVFSSTPKIATTVVVRTLESLILVVGAVVYGGAAFAVGNFTRWSSAGWSSAGWSSASSRATTPAAHRDG